MIKSWNDVFDVSALHWEGKKNKIVDSSWEPVFPKLYIQVYTQYSPCLFHTHTQNTPRVSVYVHVNTRRRSRNKAVKTRASRCSITVAFWGHIQRARGVPMWLMPFSLHLTATASHSRYAACLSPCQMGGASTHCWAQSHRNPTACKTPRFCSVHACVTACKRLGVKRRELLWELKGEGFVHLPLHANK